MSKFVESAQRVVSLMKEQGLTKGDLSENEVIKEIEALSEIAKYQGIDPMSLIATVTNLSCLYVAHYDDCNIYEEPGYYKELLEKITRFSEKGITFSDIEETWSDDGTITLCFSVDGKQERLQFDTSERDVVPSVFVDYLDKVLMAYRGSSQFFDVNDSDGGVMYYLLPSELIQKLDEIRKAHQPSF